MSKDKYLQEVSLINTFGHSFQGWLIYQAQWVQCVRFTIFFGVPQNSSF